MSDPNRPLSEADLLRLSGPAIRTFLNIAKAWGLSEAEQCQLLGEVEVETLRQWAMDRDATLSEEQLERVSHVLGIYKSLHALLAASADGWVKSQNTGPLFHGDPALDRMTESPNGLREVRSYLLAQLQGWA